MPVGIEQRPTRGSGGEWRRVLKAAADPPSAGAAKPRADADDGRGDRTGEAGDGLGELVESRHAGDSLHDASRHRFCMGGWLVTCDLQHTTDVNAVQPRSWPTMEYVSETAQPYPPATRTPLEAALDRVGDRWSLLLVDALLVGGRRFGELRDELPGLAPNILTDR